MVSTSGRKRLGIRVFAMAAVVVAPIWGFVVALVPALGCGLSDDPDAGDWYCSGGDRTFWIVTVASMAASTLLALYARHRALWTQSWVTLAVVDGLAAVAPIVTLYVIFAGR